MTDSPLSGPVGLRTRPLPALAAGSTLEVALRHTTVGPLVPVVGPGDVSLGAATAASLARAFANGAASTEPVETVLAEVVTLPPHATGAEALRAMTAANVGEALVVDGGGVYRGILLLGDLFRAPEPPRPPVVGGMATPVGVYFTTGTLGAGVPRWGLALTGALLTTILLASSQAGFLLAERLPGAWGSYAGAAIPVALFGLAMRLMPLSGIHGAEHQVVHAIERGERLIPDVVRRMPRVHPRCGTNFAAGMSLFLLLFTWRWTPDDELRLLVAALATLFFWRPIGSVLQQWVTTKRPTDRQLAGAIRGGEELLRKYALADRHNHSPFNRIWQSGMPVVMVGSFAAAGVGWAIQRWTGVDLGIR